MNPLSIVFLLPGLVSCYYVARGHLEKAFLLIYLPSLLLLPAYYFCRLPHLPPLTAADAAIVPITIGTLLRPRPYGLRFSRVDIWVALYLISLIISEVLHERVMNDGILLIISSLIGFLCPYIVGRLLIEPYLRLETVRTFVILILSLTLFGLYEFKMGINPYSILGPKLLGVAEAWGTQLRGGHARISVSLSDAELAGITFAITLSFNWWLVQVNKLDGGRSSRLGNRLSRLESKHIPGIILLIMLALTQSRGPWLGMALAYAILFIPRFKNVKAASIVVATVLIVGGIGVHSYFEKYTAGTITYDGSMSEQQASASYRRLLLENYKPIVEEGGWFGWSYLSRPIVGNQRSVDNQFLLTQIGQGRFGLICFILIGADTFWRLICYTWKFKRREDLCFAFALLAALAAVWFTITTVYLGEQLPAITFLLIGWSQSLQEGALTDNNPSAEPSAAKFSFKKVFA
jgi:hypothetical protein